MNDKSFPSLWQHQQKAVEMARELRDLALFFEPGTGKTATAINILREHFNRGKRMRRVLVLAPLVVVKNWAKEIQLHSKIPDNYVLVLNQTGAKRVKLMQKATFDPRTNTFSLPQIIITNYEFAQNKELVKLMMGWGPEILICDESHRLKNPSSKRAKEIAKIADLADHRYILTGTPILNTPMDIFFQYRILDCGQTFGVNQWTFRAKYFYDRNAGWSSKPGYFPDWQARPELFPDLTQKIYTKALFVKKSECLDLPPLITKTVEVDLSPEQKKAYEEMRDDYLTFIGSQENPDAVIAQQALTKVLRLQQIVSGFYKTADGEIKRFSKVPRLDTLSELVKDLVESTKVIIWSSFVANYEMIGEVLDKAKIPHVFLTGQQTSDEKQAAIDAFQTDPHIQVIVANQGAGGIGVNLTAAGASIVYSRDFSLERHEQSIARNYRGGSEIHDKILKIDLVAPETLDEKVAEALTKKQDISKQIIGGGVV
jgi:SNF2 family DNA or RNA helicase